MTEGHGAPRFAIPRGLDTAILRAGLAGAVESGRASLDVVDTYDAGAGALIEGRADAALVSPLTAAGRLASSVILPGFALSCRGPCPSMRLHLFARLPDVRDCGSAAFGHAAEELARLTFEAAGRAVTLVPFDGGADDALGEHDAVVTVGDVALAEETPEEATPIDLGEAWGVLSDAPFVWGVVAARPAAVDGELLDLVAKAAARGEGALPGVASGFAGEEGCSIDHAAAYLEHRLGFELGAEQRRGLESLLEAARRAGRLPADAGLAWADD